MTTGDAWTLDKKCLSEALERWHATNPDDFTRERVNEWLMDLVLDPLNRGQPDENQPGIYYGRVAGTNVGVTYVPTLETRTVCVAIIIGVDKGHA